MPRHNSAARWNPARAVLLAALVAGAVEGTRDGTATDLRSWALAVPIYVFAALLATWSMTGGPLAAWRNTAAAAPTFALVGSLAVGAGSALLQALALLTGAPVGGAGVVARDTALAWIVFAAAELLGVAPYDALRLRLRARAKAALSTLAGAAVVVSGMIVPATAANAAAADPAASAASCTASTADRVYDVAAIDVRIPYNRWGTALRHGYMYVLQQDKSAVKNWSQPLARKVDGTVDVENDVAQGRRQRPRPLVLRANEGECVQVNFTNELPDVSDNLAKMPNDPRASIHVAGPAYDVQRSDGYRVGHNEDSTVGNDPGNNSITYFWSVPEQEGLYIFRDGAMPAGGEHDAGAFGLGLHGGLAVEPAGSRWYDSETGVELSAGSPEDPRRAYYQARSKSGDAYIDASIVPPSTPTAPTKAFRESIQLAQDEIPSIGMGFNYGVEPLSSREGATRCPDCLSEETWLSSWPYGDPALIKLASGIGPWLPDPVKKEQEDCGLPTSCYVSNVFHAYNGDPTKVRFAMVGVKETHVFHLHAHQWQADPRDNKASGSGSGWKPGNSSTIDSQSFGPGEAFTADLLFGAGSRNGTFGDSIFHCHLYPHFADGFWSLMRVHDVFLDGSTRLPDGTNVRPLVKLPDRPSLRLPTAEAPGFPGMIPGKYGWRAPQPPNSITEGGANGPAATRIVAGAPISAEAKAVEDAAMARTGGGKPGAPFADPCPRGAREVNYDVTVLQRDLVYNSNGDHDTQGRLLVRTADVPAILAGTKKAEPLFFRVNAGDCINFALTNMLPNWVGGDAFQQIVQTNMVGQHIHLVKFDVTASDGASNGWNYQQAAFSAEQSTYNKEVLAGTKTCTTTPAFYGDPGNGCRLPDPLTWDPTTTSTPANLGQTIHERWYADYELRTVFTHDHHFAAVDQNRGLFGGLIVEPAGFDVRDPESGQFKQPINNSANGPVCSVSCEGQASGAIVDMVGPGVNDDFREFSLAFQDFVPLTRGGGNPRVAADVIGAPESPQVVPDGDPGTMAINYRNEPLRYRQAKSGTPVDPAYQFSSWVWGDPSTPLLQAYAGDNVKMRVIQGSQEEQHIVKINGLRWQREPDDPQSPVVSTQTLGISEAFNTVVPGVDCADIEKACTGDYLYSSAPTEDTWNGMWGIMRVHGKKVATLRPLPDNVPGQVENEPLPVPTGLPPAKAPDPGNSCPTGAPARNFDVVAMNQKVVYNKAGEHDPNGLMYVLAKDEAAVRAGDKKPEPLVIRANEGDCINVTLTNKLSQAYIDTVRHGVDGDSSLVLEPPTGSPTGARVSLHPQIVRYDVRGSDGATVGFNPDQTAGPGETISYQWYADDLPYGEAGGTNLLDFGDVRGHRHHGLFAGLTIEPKGATYYDPVTGRQVDSGVAADIRVPGRPDFREFTTFFQDGLNLRRTDGTPVEPAPEPVHPGAPAEPAVPAGEGAETEDDGEKGFNYTNAEFQHRLDAATATSRQWADVFSSKVHGDPDTPIFRAYTGDNIRMRVLQGSDKPRQHAFALDGALWRAEPDDPDSELVAVQGGISVGRNVNVHVRAGVPGDYLYRCVLGEGHLSGGLWGMLRVYDRPAATATWSPSGLAQIDDPRAAGAAPIQQLESSQVVARAFDDLNGNGVRDAGEGPLAGVTMELRTTTGTGLRTEITDAAGVATFDAPAGAYDVAMQVPAGRAATGITPARADVTTENSTDVVDLGAVRLGGTRVRVFEDLDGDRTVDPGEHALSNLLVTISGPSGSKALRTDASGMSTFTGLLPGSYTTTVRNSPGYTTTTPGAKATVVEGATGELLVGFRRAPGVTAVLYNDSNNDGRAIGELPLVGWRVYATRALNGVTQVARGYTDASGTAFLSLDGSTPLPAGSWAISAGAPAGWSCRSATVWTRPAAGADTSAGAPCVSHIARVTTQTGAAHVVTMPEHSPFAKIVVAAFEDTNRDRLRQRTEARFGGWRVEAADPATGRVVAATTTGREGTAAFSRLAPGKYTVRVVTPAGSSLPWTATTVSTKTMTLAAGQTGGLPAGFARLGMNSVVVWNDDDRSGTFDADESPLANRVVRLLSTTGTVLRTAVTDGTGRVAFDTVAGSRYVVEVLRPTGWAASAPRTSAGVPVTRLVVVGPANSLGSTVQFGQYNTVDRTPPRAAVASQAAGAYPEAIMVSLTAEVGATIRYTLDGDVPTATHGRIYRGPFRISSDKVLKSVVIDARGNVGPVAEVAYTVGTGVERTIEGPDTWTPEAPSTVRGDVNDLRRDDGRVLYLAAAGAGTSYRTAGTGTFTIPEGQREVTSLTVDYDGGATARYPRRTIEMFDFTTNSWVVVDTEVQTLEDMEAIVDVDAPQRFVAADGAVRVRVAATGTRPFELKADMLTISWRA